jgi:hypothetical protein
VRTGTTTNDEGTEIDNCGADASGVVEAEKKMMSFYFNNQSSMEDVFQKGSRAGHGEDGAKKHRVSQNRGECISRIPSESHVAC